MQLKPETSEFKKRPSWLDSEFKGLSRISIANNQATGSGLLHMRELLGHISNVWIVGSKAEQGRHRAAIKIDTHFKRIAAKLRS